MDWAAGAAAAREAADWGRDPGGAVVLFDRDGLRATAASGVESLATMTPFGIDSIVRCASVTKHVFASFVLAHPGVISLDDPLSRHLSQLGPRTGAVTVGRALDMSGGLPDTRECLTLIGQSIFTQTLAPDLLAFHAELDRLNYEPGTEVHYSNGGYRLVEEAMRAHGLLFDDFLRDELREGMGLPLRASEMWTDPVPGLCDGYWHDGQGWKIGLQGMHLSAAGSLSGSARALAEWGRALLRDEGRFAGRLAALTARRHLKDGRETGYGLGMRRHPVGGRELVGHGGSQPGFRSYLLLDPESGAGVAVVANRDDVNSSGLASGVMAALLGETLPEAGCGDLVPGLYAAPGGGDWIEVMVASVSRLDDEVAVYPQPGGGIDSLSPTSSLRLRMEGADVMGEIGHAPARFHPVAPGPMPADLAGIWRSPFGSWLEIRDGAVIMGAGPVRRAMPLQSLGQGSFLFTLTDGPWRRRICLHRTGGDGFDLILSRARVIGYRRA